MKNKKSGARTLLWSVIMSAPGPLVVGLGLLAGRSSTQIADFVRRSAELLAIIASFAVYMLTSRNGEDGFERNSILREKYERRSNLFVGAMMCLAGTLMAVLAFTAAEEDKGNVIPGLAIAVLGVIANSIFWRKYTKLNRAEPNAILAVQSRLYRAKTLVDMSVTAALFSVLIAPASRASYLLDTVGSLVVAVYLVWCGVRTVLEAVRKER